MYIFKTDTPDGADEYLSKSSKGSVSPQRTAENMLGRLQAPVVPAQPALLTEAVSPTGLILSNIADSVAVAGLVSSIGQLEKVDFAVQAANEVMRLSQAQAEEAINKNALSILANSATSVLSISSLSDPLSDQQVQGHLNLASGAPGNLLENQTPNQVIDLSLLPAGAPVLITQLSEDESAVTVIGNVQGNIHINDFVPTRVVNETFINTGLGVLTVITPATNVSSLSLTGNVQFTATAMEVATGITVSGEADNSNVVLYITGGANDVHGSTDVIKLGDGNNVVFNAGNGTVIVDLGAGSNTVVLTGRGVNGFVNFAAHNDALADTVAIADNGVYGAEALASAPLVTISGLNVGPNSSDSIVFLTAVGSNLSWSNGSAHGAKVQAAQDQSVNLVSLITQAQNQAVQAHSIAWFHFDGATYILESAGDAGAGHIGDTLIKLTGTITFSGVDGTLSQGMLHLLG